jgi:8-oxo-dGTP pyrophosphatase MutT (NUDIX family)
MDMTAGPAVAACNDAAALRALARLRLHDAGEDAPGEATGDFFANPQFRDEIIAHAGRPAAVLIPVVERSNGLSIILTRRHDDLKSHSGQVAFPGGKVDAGDAGAMAAALRETQEEIGLDPVHVSMLGRLPDYYTGSGYRIAPFVALVDPAARFAPDPREIDSMFEAPFAYLIDPRNHRPASRVWNGARRHYLEIPWQGYTIWGVTAGIIRVLAGRLFP